MKNKYSYGAVLIASIGLFAFTVSANSSLFFSNNTNQAAVISVADPKIDDLSNNHVQSNFSILSSLNSEIIDSVKTDGRGGVALMNSGRKIQIINNAKLRKIAAKALLRDNPLLFISNTIPINTKILLPTEAQNEIETKKLITGDVDVVAIDDFNNPKNSRNVYYINIDGNKYNLYPVSDLNIISGTRIQANGYILDNDVVVDTNNDNVKILESRAGLAYADKKFSSIGDQRTLVLLIKSFSSDKEPFTPAQAKDLVFNGQFQKFMQEQSYGRVSFSGDVFGWYTIGRALSCYGGNNGAMPTNLELGNMVNQYGIDLNNYDRIVYLSTAHGTTYGACSSIGKGNYVINGTMYSISQMIVEGLASYNSPSNWGQQPFSWTNLDYVLAHEMGHSLGVGHANGWSCSDNKILYGDCQHIEYGNPYDAMGNLSYSLDYNAYFKEKLGWIPPSQVLSVTQPGSYSVNPIEIQNGIKLIKVNIPNTQITPFFVEFRKAIGFDSNLNGLYIQDNQQGIFINHIQNESVPQTELLDMTPGKYSVYNWPNYTKQATLNYLPADNPNRSLVDDGRGIIIGPVSDVSTSSITFNIDLKQPSCSHFSPSLNYNYPSYVSAGSLSYISIIIKNEDYYGCGSSNFDVSLVSPQWKATEYPEEDLVLAPEKSGNKILQYRVPADTVPGIYTVVFGVSNKSAGLTITKSVQITVAAPPTIKEINPVFGPIGTMVSITGTGFINGDRNQVDVYMCGSGCSVTQKLTSIDGKIIYTIPSEIQVYDFINKGWHNILTPDGDYKIYVYVNNTEVGADFHVGKQVIKPTAILADKKVLSLNYDSVGGESELVSTFNVMISPGSEDQKISKNGAFLSYIKDEKGQVIAYTQLTYPQPPGVTDDGNGYYVIPSQIGTTTFTVTAKFNPKAMFAGTYYGVMKQVVLGDVKTNAIIFSEPNTTNKVTIIGELSPYLDLIYPTISSPRDIVTISGKKLPTGDNVVNLVNIVSNKKTTVYASGSSNEIKFKPTVSPGDYIVSVTDPKTGDSNSLSLKVLRSDVVPPTVYIGGKRILSLKYDPKGEESELVSTFNVMISPGSEDQKLYKFNAFGSFLKQDGNGEIVYGQLTYPQPPGVTDDGNGYYVIPSQIGTTTFTVTAKFNPKAMFAGTYYGVMDHLIFGYMNIFPITQSNNTNKVTIVGELSPYINSISSSKEGVASDTTVILSGVRFPNKGNVVNLVDVLTGKKTTVFAIGSENGTKLQFKPSVSPGNYIVSVTHPTTGDSNVRYLIVTSPATQSSPELFRSASGVAGQSTNTSSVPNQSPSAVPTSAPSPQYVPTSPSTIQPSPQPSSIPVNDQTSNIFNSLENLLKTVFNH